MQRAAELTAGAADRVANRERVDLTYKQRLFVEHYLGESNGNATDAARRAGYSSPDQLGPRLVKKRTVQAAISARVAKAAMPANEVLARLSEIATGSLGDFIDVQANNSWALNLKKARGGGKLKLLKKLKSGEHGPEIEIHDPLAALEKLARYHGLYVEKADVTIAAGTQTLREFLDDDTPDAPKRKAAKKPKPPR